MRPGQEVTYVRTKLQGGSAHKGAKGLMQKSYTEDQMRAAVMDFNAELIAKG